MPGTRVLIALSTVALGLASACFDPSSHDYPATRHESSSGSSAGDDSASSEESGTSPPVDESSGAAPLDETSSSTTGDDDSLPESTSESDGTEAGDDLLPNAESFCGDGMIDRQEECDDANAADDDGCSECQIESGWSCGDEPSVCASAECDPLVQDCAAGLGCYPLEPMWACAPDDSGVEGQQGDPCDGFGDCSPGRACVSVDAYPGCDGTTGCCARVCDLAAPVCSSQLDCTPWYAVGQAPPGLDNTGVCV